MTASKALQPVEAFEVGIAPDIEAVTFRIIYSPIPGPPGRTASTKTYGLHRQEARRMAQALREAADQLDALQLPPPSLQ